ncbi:MAG: T9SS type A sorting domain-containing protein [Eudoraea sp.]|nr:T9SS type A sorting domain-containing protein [Eudoraea sp.]
MAQYFATKIDTNDCLIVDGIDPSQQAQGNIYPNPAGSDLTVKIELEQSSTTHLRIIDLTGKVVKDASREFTFEHGIYKAKLDISKLQSGIYFVRVEQADKVYTKKLVVR